MNDLRVAISSTPRAVSPFGLRPEQMDEYETELDDVYHELETWKSIRLQKIPYNSGKSTPSPESHLLELSRTLADVFAFSLMIQVGWMADNLRDIFYACCIYCMIFLHCITPPVELPNVFLSLTI